MLKRISVVAATIGAAALLTAGLAGAAFAQTPDQPTSTPQAQSGAGGRQDRGLPPGGARSGISSKVTIEVASRLTGLTTEEIRTLQKAGQPLAQIAEAKGIAREALIKAVVEAQTAAINEKEAAGTLTQTQADAALARVKALVTSEVERACTKASRDDTGPTDKVSGRKDAGSQSAPGLGSGLSASVTAQLTGLTEAEVLAQEQAGQPLAQIAEARGVTRDALVKAIVAAKTAAINGAVKAGTLTQAQADTMIAGLEAQVTARVDRAVTAPDAGTQAPRRGQSGAGKGGMRGQTTNPQSAQ